MEIIQKLSLPVLALVILVGIIIICRLDDA